MKKTIRLCAITALALLASTTAIVLASKTNSFAKAFAGLQLNEYGCVSNCTGEYYPSHINQLVKANKDLNGTANVRVICKVSNNGWYQDVDNDAVYTSWDAKKDDQFRHDWACGLVITTSGTWSNYKKLKAGDTVSFFGTINYRAKGNGYDYDTVEIVNPTLYGVNDTIDTSLLPDVVYLQ